MLKIGIIGDIKSLEPYIEKIRKNKEVQIAGKSSVGIISGPESVQFTIPEFNRIELIDRSDALIINNFSLFSFSVLCDMVKKSKHIFAAEYPALSMEECAHLVKLTHEAKAVFQFVNPYYSFAPVQWLNKNVKLPALFDITFFNSDFDHKNTLIRLLLMLKNSTGMNSKRTGAVAFQGESKQSLFNNLNLQFGDASVVNINYGKIDSLNEFIVKVYSEGQFITLNFLSKNYRLNNREIDLKSTPGIDEFDFFIDSIKAEKRHATDIEDYFAVAEAIQKAKKKISQFTTG